MQSTERVYHPPPVTFTCGEKTKFFLTDTKFHKFLWMFVIVAYGFLLAWTVEANQEDSNKTTAQGENTYKGYRWTVMFIVIGSAAVTAFFEFIGFNVRFKHPYASINLVFQTILGYLVWGCGVLALIYLVLQELQVELWVVFRGMSHTRRAQFALILIAMVVLGIGQIARMYTQHFDSIKAALGVDEWRDEDDENIVENTWWDIMGGFGVKREWKIERERKKRVKMIEERHKYGTGPRYVAQPYEFDSAATIPNTNPTFDSQYYNTPSGPVAGGNVSEL